MTHEQALSKVKAKYFPNCTCITRKNDKTTAYIDYLIAVEENRVTSHANLFTVLVVHEYESSDGMTHYVLVISPTHAHAFFSRDRNSILDLSLTA